MTMPENGGAARPDQPDEAAANLAAVHARIAAAAHAAGRDPAAVVLVGVSKQQPEARIEAMLRAGLRVFGENRVQEAAGRWPPLRERWPGISLRLIGPLQTNKARQAVALFDAIDSLDRPRLAAALAEEMARAGRRLPCLIQVNTGEEPQKAGIMPAEVAGFVAACRDTWQLPVEGFMCIPPADDDPAPHFAFLRELSVRHGLPQLSMGMSGDYEVAVRLGATFVRVGSALFGGRLPRG